MRRCLVKRKNGFTRLAGICGILVPFVVFATLGFCLAVSPWFTWTNHALSDLGIQRNTAILFNNGLMLGGILCLIFSLGLIKILSNKTGAYLLGVSSLALIGIGLFPETIFSLHLLSSASFFILLTIALLIIGMNSKKNLFEKQIGSLALMLATIAISSTVFLFHLDGVAVSEACACFPAFVWCSFVGIKMIRF